MYRELCEFHAEGTPGLTRSCVTETGSDSIEPSRKPLKTGMRVAKTKTISTPDRRRQGWKNSTLKRKSISSKRTAKWDHMSHKSSEEQMALTKVNHQRGEK